MSSDDVLNAIDHAVEDWQVSVDAMRWMPEPQTDVASHRDLIFPPFSILDEMRFGVGEVYISELGSLAHWLSIGSLATDPRAIVRGISGC